MFLICRPTKIPSFIFASLKWGISAADIKNRAILLHSSDKFFTKPSFICTGGKNTFAESTKVL
jgi:hypothetical protein